MVLTLLPGFTDPVHHAQTSFRTLLQAMAMPGQPQRIPVILTPPVGLDPATAALGLTLFDLDTCIWLQAGWGKAVEDWFQFHTGCRFVPDPQAANFAVIWDAVTMPDLSAFQVGTAEKPEDSTTLWIQVPSVEGGDPVTVTGPGIQTSRELGIQGIPTGFWQQWQQNSRTYPMGVDVVWIAGDAIVGLPRTSRIGRT